MPELPASSTNRGGLAAPCPSPAMPVANHVTPTTATTIAIATTMLAARRLIGALWRGEAAL